MSVAVCPAGQVRPTSSAVGAESVSVPVRLPFLSTGKLPVALTGLVDFVFFLSDGMLVPPLTQEYVVAAVAVAVMVSVDPAESPASLKLMTRSVPERVAEVALWMKWALPVSGALASAGTAARASAISDSTAMMPSFLIKVFSFCLVGLYRSL